MLNATDYCIVCDDVRMEDNRKHLLIGVYSGNLVVPSLPALLSLCFYCHLPSMRRFKSIEISLKNPKGEDLIPPCVAEMKKQGAGIGVLRFGVIRFSQTGEHRLTISAPKKKAVFTHSFGVELPKAEHARETTRRKREKRKGK